MGYTDSYKAEDDPTLFFKYEEDELDQDDVEWGADRYQIHNANTLATIGKPVKNFKFSDDKTFNLDVKPLDL